MGVITYQHNKINTYVKPEVVKSSSDIYTAMTITQSINCPSDFLYKQYINNLYNNLSNLRKNVQGINFWLLEANTKINNFESKRKTGIKNIGTVNKNNSIKTKINKQSFSAKKIDNDAKNNKMNLDNISDSAASIFNWGIDKAREVGAAVTAEVNSAIKAGQVVVKSGVETVKNTSAKVAEQVKCAWDWGVEQAKAVGANVSEASEAFWSWLKEAANKVLELIERTAATILTAIQSIIKGLLEFVEAVLDFAVILGSGIASIGTGIVDGVSYIVTGEALGVTKGLWDWTKGYVSYQVVDGLADVLYQDTAYGKWLSEKSFMNPNGTAAEILSGIGYVAGVVVLSIATFGTGGAAVSATSTGASSAAVGISSAGTAAVAGAAGIGKGTSDAWNDGASTVKGLGYGAINGVIEAAQYYAGGKISQISVTGAKTVGQKFINSAVRVVLDGADSAVEVPIYAALKGIYNDQNFTKNWEEAGGWKAVGTAAAVGSISSGVGESGVTDKAVRAFSKSFQLTKGVVKNITASSEAKLASGKISLAKVSIATLASPITILPRFKYSKLDKSMIDKCSKEGIFHITSAENVEKILASNYVKKSKGFLTNYGTTQKSFFFGGVPSFENVAVNLDTVQPKLTAVKIMPTRSDLENVKFRYRKYNDKAVTFDGDFDFTGREASQAYFVLVEDGNKLSYKEVSKFEFDNYTPNFKNVYNEKITNGFAQSLKGMLKGLESQLDIFANGLKELNNIKVFNSSFLEKFDFKLQRQALNNSGTVDLSAFKNSSKKSFDNNVEINIETRTQNLNLKVEQYNKYINIKKSDGYKRYLLDLREGNTIDLQMAPIYDNLEANIAHLEKEINYEYENINKLLAKNTVKQTLNLKKQIFDSMPKNLSDIEKARYIYINLSKRVNYDPNYLLTKNKDIYNKVLNINNLKDNKVICKGWSELYKQLLLEAGFDEKNVTIVGGTKVGSHKYVEIKFDNFKIYADATNNYSGVTDLAATKVGMQTTGFVPAPLDLNLVGHEFKDQKNFFISQTANNEKWLKSLDVKVYNQGKYVEETYSKINTTFNNSSTYSKLFGPNVSKSIDLKINTLNPTIKKLDGLESYTYLSKIRNVIFDNKEKNNVKITLLAKTDNNYKGELVNCISVKKLDNSYRYYINRDGTGMVEVTANDVNNLLATGYSKKNGDDIFGFAD